MKRRVWFLLVLFLVLECDSRLSFAQEKIPVKFEEVDIQESCFVLEILVNTPQFERNKGKPYLEEELVIDTDGAYDEFQKTISNARNMACKNVNFPAVDFSSKTLLGKLAGGSCAARDFKKEVYRDDAKKEIVYSVQVIERHDPNVAYFKCAPVDSINLIAIPKIPKDYKVVFIPPSPDKSKSYRSFGCEDGKMVTRDWNGNIVEPSQAPPPGGGVFGVQMDCGGGKWEEHRYNKDGKRID
ncbi:MAG: hypothetical protein Q8Q08_04055 [Candidatus Omnitrophota bacterium]|nr:hypothetical protein [Candidatus Omnitrophota bacterium]